MSPDVAAVWSDMTRLPVRTVAGLRQLVHAAVRPCASYPDVFDADGGNTGVARVVCAGCPVRAACAALAMSPVAPLAVRGERAGSPMVYAAEGVYGGLTAAERRSLTRAWWELVPAVRPADGRVRVAVQRRARREGVPA